MAGQRTKLILGDVKADVTLVKTSSESAGPRFDVVQMDTSTGRAVVESTAEAEAEPVMLGGGESLASSMARAGVTVSADPSVAPGTIEVRDPEAPIEGPLTQARGRDLARPTPVIPQTQQQALERDAAAGYVAPVRQVRGVYTESGEFIDLTELLADIDEHVKLDGLTVAKSIDANAVPRDRVRGSFFIEPPAGKSPGAALSTRVRDLLWTVLSDERRALVVRWTKRTNQALGIIVASKAHDALMLLEVEWGPNMRKPSVRAQVTHDFEPSDAEREAARDFLRRTAAPASALDTLADERRVLQLQALHLAKDEGKVLELPERHSEDEALAAALGAGS